MKPYLVFMAGPNSLSDLIELITPIKPYLRGICALLHDCDERAEELEYLIKINNELGAGNIILGTYIGRHDHSRNRILYETGIKDGDWYIQTDVLEHPKSEFLQNVPNLIKSNPSLGCLFYYGKPFLVKFNEWLKYSGNPHEGLNGIKGQSIEYSAAFQDESKVRQNMRPFKRKDPLHFVNHYGKYYFFPSSNQCLLGLEKRPSDSFERRMSLRQHLMDYMRDKGYEFTLENFIKMVKYEGIYHELKKYINAEKILQDVVRLNVLGEKDIVDEHEWLTMKTY